MKRIYTLGETTYDIILKQGKPIDAKVGGSAVNTAVSLGRLGVPVSMVAACGSDDIGIITQDFLEKNRIDTSLLTIYNGTSRIALAFLDEQNNAHYNFYNGQNNNNKTISFPNDVQSGLILFGSSFGIKAEIRRSLVEFLKQSRHNSNLIFYDPNARPSQLAGNQNTKEWIIENLKLADIIKGSDEDFLMLFDAKSPDEAYKSIQTINPLAVLLVTANEKGADLFTPAFSKHYDVPKITPLSTIGAGDTFSAGIIYGLFNAEVSEKEFSVITENQWDNALHYAITFATQVCMSFDNYISDSQ